MDYPQLQYQQSGLEAGGTSFPISYLTGAWRAPAPIHIVGIDQELDQRADRRRTPHSLTQDYLNRSEALWGMVTNGAKLRLLRDSARLSKPTYLEFDIQAMMGRQCLRRLCRTLSPAPRNQAAAERHGAPRMSGSKATITRESEEGGRVREKLRDGVKSAPGNTGDSPGPTPRK